MIIGTHVLLSIQAMLENAPLHTGEFRRIEGMGETYFSMQHMEDARMQRLFDIKVGETHYSVYKKIEPTNTG